MNKKTKYMLAAGVLSSAMFISGCKADNASWARNIKNNQSKFKPSISTTPKELELNKYELDQLRETIPNVDIVIADPPAEPEDNYTNEEELPQLDQTEPIEQTYTYDTCCITEETELKSGPANVYPTIKNLAINDKATRVFSDDNGWDLIKCNESFGYIKSDSISYQKETTNTPQAYVLTRHNDIVFTNTILNFRAAPNTDSEIIQTFNVETELQVIATVDNGWLAVQYNGQIGFVSGEYTISMLEIAQSIYPELELEELKLQKIVYATTSLNLRCGNSTDFDALLMLEKYESLRVLGEYDGWYFVMTNERNLGFVSKDFTREIENKSTVIDKSCQQLYYYDENKLIYTTEVTTGKDTTPSDTGLFRIWRKDTDTYLTDNKTYNSHVDYCMYYNAGEAIHDADWRYMFYVQNQPERKKFGSEQYHTYGSHGCINTPHDIVEKIYNEVEVGNQVLVHK